MYQPHNFPCAAHLKISSHTAPRKLWSFKCFSTFTFSIMSYQWNYTVWSFLQSGIFHLALEIQHVVVHIRSCVYQEIILFMDGVVFHVKDHSYFIHLLVEGHLGLFQFLVIVSKAIFIPLKYLWFSLWLPFWIIF